MRKRGTTRGSPRRSRTAKALRISRIGEIVVCLRVGRMGPISVDGPGQHNPDRSEGPWGRRREVAVTDGATGPTLIGKTGCGRVGHEGRRQTTDASGNAGSKLNRRVVWEGPV